MSGENPTVNRIAVFADVQNIYYTTRDAFGRQFNYRQLMTQLAEQGNVVSATAYAIDRGDDKQQKFQSALKHLGFKVKLKPFIQRRDGSAKGDWDVGITIDVMEMTKDVDTVVLLSGDGDFDLLMRKIGSDYGVRTEAYGVAELTARSLVDAVDVFHAIDDELLL
jgi:uncharacterized LabA/DUF88 family protein